MLVVKDFQPFFPASLPTIFLYTPCFLTTWNCFSLSRPSTFRSLYIKNSSCVLFVANSLILLFWDPKNKTSYAMPGLLTYRNWELFLSCLVCGKLIWSNRKKYERSGVYISSLWIWVNFYGCLDWKVAVQVMLLVLLA